MTLTFAQPEGPKRIYRSSGDHEAMFPTIRCEACEIQYGGFEGDVLKKCSHCGQGLMVQIMPEDPTYGQRGLEQTGGNAQMQAAYTRMQRQQQQ